MRTIVGGFEEVCKNYKREINLFINEYDAEMMVGNLMKKKEHLPDFSCEYFIDNDNFLVGLFWSDGESKGKYQVLNGVCFKVGVTLCNTTDFKQRICDIVWIDSLSPDEFKEGWHSVIEDFDLTNNNWLADIFELRESWIPA
ncbi:hypothetical protein QVD17_24990 [Tagetes erecta]|uniref:Uncharacterized protein n=1 Tax=Tagetes erecta TaxID=13708 RepID=A0AAD8NV24_TARER|nr:hypothetical protein QVD17_24990 [Tagetes erecta]